jgi:hypothetical protein
MTIPSPPPPPTYPPPPPQREPLALRAGLYLAILIAAFAALGVLFAVAYAMGLPLPK